MATHSGTLDRRSLGARLLPMIEETEMTEEWPSELLAFIEGEVAMNDEPLAAETDLLLTGTVDSLGVIRITHWLEERTGVPVPPGDVTVENFQSVSAIATYVDRTLSRSES